MRRNKTEVLIDIVRVLHGQRLKLTHIMCKANIDGGSLKKRLQHLCDVGFVAKSTSNSKMTRFQMKGRPAHFLYIATKKGVDVVKAYDELLATLGGEVVKG